MSYDFTQRVFKRGTPEYDELTRLITSDPLLADHHYLDECAIQINEEQVLLERICFDDSGQVRLLDTDTILTRTEIYLIPEDSWLSWLTPPQYVSPVMDQDIEPVVVDHGSGKSVVVVPALISTPSLLPTTPTLLDTYPLSTTPIPTPVPTTTTYPFSDGVVSVRMVGEDGYPTDVGTVDTSALLSSLDVMPHDIWVQMSSDVESSSSSDGSDDGMDTDDDQIVTDTSIDPYNPYDL